MKSHKLATDLFKATISVYFLFYVFRVAFLSDFLLLIAYYRYDVNC